MSVRRALLFSLCLAIPGWSCRPGGASGGRIDLKSAEMELGTGGLTHPDRWNRVLVSATAVDGLFQGEVQASGRTQSGGSSLETFRREFAVSKERQTSELMVRPRGWDELEVSFRSRGWSGAGRQKLDWSRESE